MKAYGGVNVYIHVFLTSELVGGEWSASCTGYFTPGTHCIGGWEGPRTGVDEVKMKIFLLPGLGLRPLVRAARRQSTPLHLQNESTDYV
jgi:hypothetical protein